MDRSKFVNNEAETEVLGAVLLENKAFKDIIDILVAEDFYNKSHSIIFDTMKKLYITNTPIDVTTLFNDLGNNAGSVGGLTYICELAGTCPSAKNVMSYANIVKEKSGKRKLYKVLNKSLQDIGNGDDKNASIIDNLQNDFRRIEFYESKRNGDLEIPVQNYLLLLEKRSKNKGLIEGYSTGFKSIDDFSGGFQKQDLVILAARPSMGKSAVALNMASNMAVKMKYKVAFFHLEMNQLSTIQRIIANTAKIPMDNLKKADLTDKQWTDVVNKSEELASSQLSIYDEVYSLMEIRSECKRLKLQKGLDVVFIDYLQLIESSGGKENRNESVSQISRGLKLLAKELNITIVAISQLSRAPEIRSSHRPILSDLRDSGTLEQDADVVMFLYRDEYYHEDTEDKGVIEFIIAKHRNGETGTIKAAWEGRYQRVVA